MDNNNSPKRLIIIDGYGFIFRAYHVQPPLISPKGQAVGAIYGFTSMLLKLINDFKPEYAVIVLDNGEKNFRHHLYPEYKAHRPPAPEDLISQLKLIKSVASALNFHYISKIGYEADDIIASLAHVAAKQQQKAVIVSADKDLMQLQNEYIHIYDPVKAKYITQEDIFAKFGVRPDQVREVQALIGDSADNIPGVKGIGPKTAASLINQYGTVENIYQSLRELTPRQQAMLMSDKEAALMSWQLVGLAVDIEIEQGLDEFTWSPPHPEIIAAFIHEYGFKSLYKRMENIFQMKLSTTQELETKASSNINKVTNIHKLQLSGEFAQFHEKIKQEGRVAVQLNNHQEKYEICLCHGENIFLLEDYGSKMAPELKHEIDAIFSDHGIKKITYNLKALLKILPQDGLNACDDIMLMHYILNGGTKHDLWQELSDNAASNGTQIVALFGQYYDALYQQLVSESVLHLYENLEKPLSYILHAMEIEGVGIDSAYLRFLSQELQGKISLLEEKIFIKTGVKFNIASPKQLGEILFDKLALMYPAKKKANAGYSTNADILEALSAQGEEIADWILEYRHLSKLKNTYTDTLPEQINPITSRVHTSFMQCATSTGRLSSVNPNLQNIPIRTQEGNNIRKAFIAREGYGLISADYSQIELRILSHVASIEPLKYAFAHGVDVHAHTASQVFNIDIAAVTPEIRRKAKAINFGIIYGISAFGLAKQLGIDKKEAAEYMKKYFIHYPGIEAYMKKAIEFARENGFVKNLLGRKIFVPAINSKEHIMRSFSERAAINAPMQSLAAEVIKMAMINANRALMKNGLGARLLLQIHDELLFECPMAELDETAPVIKKAMESIHLLGIKLSVNVKTGPNWQEMTEL